MGSRTASLPRICIALGLGDVDKLMAHARDELRAGETFLEFRLDYLPNPMQGVDAIRPLQAAFLALDPTFTHEIVGVVEGDGVAIVKTDWHMRLPDGGEQSGRSCDIVRRQPDGSWLLAIDDPWARG